MAAAVASPLHLDEKEGPTARPSISLPEEGAPARARIVVACYTLPPCGYDPPGVRSPGFRPLPPKAALRKALQEKMAALETAYAFQWSSYHSLAHESALLEQQLHRELSVTAIETKVRSLERRAAYMEPEKGSTFVWTGIDRMLKEKAEKNRRLDEIYSAIEELHMTMHANRREKDEIQMWLGVL